RYVTDTPLAYLVGLLAIKKSAFDKISATDQAIVRQEVARAIESLDKTTRAGNLQATQALKNQGFVFVEPDEEEIAHWRWLADKSLERLVDKGALTGDGVKLVKHYLCDYRYGSRQ
ncbi:MAG: TRAP transporter substrate-binding protein DctP, partial [Gammaproteobacteria bacterium]